MKRKQFIKWLEANGVNVGNGTKHYELRYQGKVSRLSRSSDDISPQRMKLVKKQLGMTE
ncbi:mRNA interferase [[Haemophilus] felis]|nr:mRNA interferase [[Haemophilus] felis]NBI40173.1 mRNA interferase [[Haemophilus] felis]NBI43444.1 mRNA interferase [[Haemophilus] felis]